MTIKEQVDTLMDQNQALKAWDLVKDTPGELHDQVWVKVKHAFDKDAYLDFYGKHDDENPLPMELSLDCTKMNTRMLWLVTRIVEQGQRRVMDLGCADGYLDLTLARYGHLCYGVNLQKKSVAIANYRAFLTRLPAYFEVKDIFDVTGEYDAVVLAEVLEHLPNPEAAIAFAFLLVRPGGSLYLTTPRHDHEGIRQHLAEKDRLPWDDGKPAGHLRLWTEEEFKNMLKAYNIVQFLVDDMRNMLVEIKR